MNKILMVSACLIISVSYSQTTEEKKATTTTTQKSVKKPISKKKKKLPNAFENKSSLNVQFDYIYKTSTTYKDYKVIRIKTYNLLKSGVLDSINQHKSTITEKESTIDHQNKKIKNLDDQLATTNERLNTTLSGNDQRIFLGVVTNKSTFSMLLGLSFTVIIGLLIFFIFKYRNNISNTRKAIEDFETLTIEFEQHKRTSLKRFQEVNRKLQDELNKKWKGEK